MSKDPKVNEYRITIRAWRAAEGLEDQDDFMQRLEEITSDSIAPALCVDGCEVEPDGKCQHGCPSILIAYGLC